jgi:micrococcal nuclease
VVFVTALLLTTLLAGASSARADHTTSCTVASVVDGDTFDCIDGTRVRLLQIDTPEIGACGGQWAKAALANIFLKAGTQTRLEYDAVTEDQYGRHLAAPIVVGTDGTDYNISIVMVYVGLARAAYYGDNAKYLDWANASETYARVAQWNMWQPGGPFAGGTFGDENCGAASPAAPSPPGSGNCDPSYPDVCIPSPPPDLDCPQISERNFRVIGADPHRLDGDNDGIGCET